MKSTNTTGLAAAPDRKKIEPRRFSPRLSLGHQQDLLALVRDLDGHGLEGRISLIRSSIDTAETHREMLRQRGVQSDDQQPSIVYLACLRVLRDLTLQGWVAGTDDNGVYILPPSFGTAGEDPSEAKSDIRNSFRFALADQLLTPSVEAFVRRMEEGGIAALFADGPELSARIEGASATDTLSNAVLPFLQLVEGDARDPSTDLRLQDIWRYARLQWSIPYQSTPGRTIHYLIRDEAGPNSPIIGIAALGNAILGLNQRDEALGWTVSALNIRLNESNPAENLRIARHLLAFARAESERIYTEDFKLSGLSTAEKIRYLEHIEVAADVARNKDLTDAGDERTTEYELIRRAHDLVAADEAEKVDWARIAKSQLYRRKRAANLADTFRVIDAFEKADLESNPDAIRDMINSEEGRRCVEILLRRIKQQAIAENIMEIITCGAVAPYQQLLGGKLVAMLMASPQVVEDVRKRYSGKVSLIASGMAGRAIIRTPALSVLTTSSLYALGSAQYNRIRIPGEIVGVPNDEIRYKRVGSTESFGTVQFASDTIESMAKAARLAQGKKRLINNLFGEGMSPKLRSLRLGLGALGLAANEYLRHHSPRLLFTASLVTNADDIMLGLSRTPRYVLPITVGLSTTEAIARYWFERWVKPRLSRPETIERLRYIIRDDHMVSRVASELRSFNAAITDREVRDEGSTPNTPNHIVSSEESIGFVEKLYRNSNSFADRLTDDQLHWIHVDLGLDEFILEAAEEKKQLIITGNPGDGKTFIIQRLRASLLEKGATIITDANACSDSEVLSAWRSCDEKNLPFVLAINEWPLFELHRLAVLEGFTPVDEAIRQVKQAVYYATPPDSEKGRVQVVDLNLRNVLAKSVSIAAVKCLTADRFVEQLDELDPARANVERLRHPRVQERLGALLEQVSRRGQHTTMRQLMGYIAFMITGGTNSTQRFAACMDIRFIYSDLAFEGGEGPLFSLVRTAFDPARITHPVYDEKLWRGTTDPKDWINPNDVPAAASACAEPDRKRFFRVAKRRFFFEHIAGIELLSALPSDEAAFDTILKDGIGGDPQIVRRMILAINHFFEPDAGDDDNLLTLWQSHRFDVQAPAAFVALYHEKADAMSVHGPALASWVQRWLRADLWRPHQFALQTSSQGGQQSRLLIDRELYLTLQEAAVGLGRSTWSRSIARKVTRFVDEIHRFYHSPSPMADLDIRNVDTNQLVHVRILRNQRRYQL